MNIWKRLYPQEPRPNITYINVGRGYSGISTEEATKEMKEKFLIDNAHDYFSEKNVMVVDELTFSGNSLAEAVRRVKGLSDSATVYGTAFNLTYDREHAKSHLKYYPDIPPSEPIRIGEEHDLGTVGVLALKSHDYLVQEEPKSTFTTKIDKKNGDEPYRRRRRQSSYETCQYKLGLVGKYEKIDAISIQKVDEHIKKISSQNTSINLEEKRANEAEMEKELREIQNSNGRKDYNIRYKNWYNKWRDLIVVQEIEHWKRIKTALEYLQAN